MPFFEWKDAYSVGIKEFDSQHKRLVDLINRLYESMTAGKGAANAASIISELVDYTKVHFSNEEKYMVMHGYPSYKNHLAEHTKLTAQVVDFQTKVQTGAAVVSIDLLHFLKDWLTNHIMGTDKQYTEFFHQKGM
jgi:hemerythrin-like metal-binding protein